MIREVQSAISREGGLRESMVGKARRDIRILVVDDMTIVGSLFKRFLRGKGCSVITAGRGEEALAKVKRELFDLIFLDIVMPGMDGVGTLKAVKRISPQTPVVMMTGYALENQVEKALKLGASECLRKPFGVTEIMSVIDKVLGEKRG